MIETDILTGKYVYGIIRCADARVIAARGIHEQGLRVYTLPYRDLAVVISDSPYEEYDSSRRNMMAHTRVLEAVMQEYTVLPICFGVVAPDAGTIQEQLLAPRYADLVAQLDELDGRIELGLKAFWADERVFREIADQQPDIRTLRDSIAPRPPESTYYERIRLGELVEAAVTQRRAADSEQIMDALRPLARTFVTHPVLTDRMVVNAAFLLDRADEARFDAAVHDLDARFGAQMMFKYVGPVPPYNFVSLTVHWS
ncbi:GvpL/GvpF family gas vesicle protein [Oscillochloris sp. ZM17-4]|uniref:GvpL/GvpF family gas vesicle protein n=1 Tax=Oscillochloris sp. ZM17-4 TaxID=2866714 RepID=UPI001C7361FB|nr:GvpL/GvpF family gas vesicle protein [Oscillochloris sp. ZM17-4]MBX0331531.1 GvpL/GvpF family gas vesicle protein [Oscillochloris sp. ZM17-4]